MGGDEVYDGHGDRDGDGVGAVVGIGNGDGDGEQDGASCWESSKLDLILKFYSQNVYVAIVAAFAT